MTNTTGVPREVACLDAKALAPVVGCALGRERVELGQWMWTCLHKREDGGVFRVAGTETGNNDAWSLVLKVISTDGDPRAMTYPNRERLAYASGLLNDLPNGLAAPRCYRIDDHCEGRAFLWLEDITDAASGDWPLVQYEMAARHLGQFHGIYLTTRRRPSFSWLRTWPVRLPPARLQHAVDVIGLPGVWDNALFRQVIPHPVGERLLTLWADAPALEATLAEVPQTLCHGDAFRRNLRFPSDNSDRMVALDWEHVGIGALGEDPARLVALGLLFGDAERVTASDLAAGVFAGYLSGLRGVGWSGNTCLASLGYTAAIALFAIGIAGMMIDYIASPDEAVRSQPEQWCHRPIEAVAQRWAEAIYLMLDLADEARKLRPTA